MTDHDTTIRETREYRDALTSGDVITVQIKSTAKPLVPVDPDKLSGMLEALLAVIEQQQATIDRQAEALRQVGDKAEWMGELEDGVDDLTDGCTPADAVAIDGQHILRILDAGGEG